MKKRHLDIKNDTLTQKNVFLCYAKVIHGMKY